MRSSPASIVRSFRAMRRQGFDDAAGVALAGLLEQGHEQLAQLHLLLDAGRPPRPEEPVAHGLQVLVAGDEVFEDVGQVPKDFQAHLDFTPQAFQPLDQGVVVASQDAAQLVFALGNGAEDDGQDGPLLGQVAQHAVVGRQVGPLRADLPRRDAADNGGQAAFDEGFHLRVADAAGPAQRPVRDGNPVEIHPGMAGG